MECLFNLTKLIVCIYKYNILYDIYEHLLYIHNDRVSYRDCLDKIHRKKDFLYYRTLYKMHLVIIYIKKHFEIRNLSSFKRFLRLYLEY